MRPTATENARRASRGPLCRSSSQWPGAEGLELRDGLGPALRIPRIVLGVSPLLKEADHLDPRPEHAPLPVQDGWRKPPLADKPPGCRPSDTTVELDVPDVPVLRGSWILDRLLLGADAHVEAMRLDPAADATEIATRSPPPCALPRQPTRACPVDKRRSIDRTPLPPMGPTNFGERHAAH